jgi:hypothetical protein
VAVAAVALGSAGSNRTSEWVSGRRLGSVHPDRRSCRVGAGEQDERALAIGEAALGPDHPYVATYRSSFDGVLQALLEPPPEGPASDL